jgi:hypothetical protein
VEESLSDKLGCDSRLNGELPTEQAAMRGELRNCIATGYTKYVDDYGEARITSTTQGF